MAEINKIAFFEVEDWEKDYIRENLPDTEIKLFNEKLTEKNINEAQDCDAIAVFIYSRLTKDILSKLPELKLIVTMSTGFDHIDLDECKARNITVCNVPTYGENTVAEHTFSLILALSRKIIKSVDRTRTGDFNLDELRGFDLKGKTIGIIGCGNIGKHVVRMAKGFEMNIIVFDLNKDEKYAKELGFSYADFDELLSKSDIISLHAPYNEKTHHMINKDNIKKIKKGAYIINTARGGLLDTEALFAALKEGHIAGAGIDVMEEETTIKEEKELLSADFIKTSNMQTLLENHMLMHMDNVIITPHNAFNSQEALMRIINTTLENIKDFKNNECRNSVKK